MNTNELCDQWLIDFDSDNDRLPSRLETFQAGYDAAMREMAEMEPACIILRNTAGQISQRGADGDYFDMSKYVGQKLIPRPTIKGESK